VNRIAYRVLRMAQSAFGRRPFEKTKPISGSPNERNINYNKGLRQECRSWKLKKQSQFQDAELDVEWIPAGVYPAPGCGAGMTNGQPLCGGGIATT
jgi:hypothetical protein